MPNESSKRSRGPVGPSRGPAGPSRRRAPIGPAAPPRQAQSNDEDELDFEEDEEPVAPVGEDPLDEDDEEAGPALPPGMLGGPSRPTAGPSRPRGQSERNLAVSQLLCTRAYAVCAACLLL